MASHVYLTAVGVPAERARLLVEALKERSQLELFVDPSAGGTSISEFHHSAAGVVVLWGDSQVTTTYETNSGIRANKPTVIVRMTAGVPLPETIRDLAVVDLASWAGGDHDELDRLISQLEIIANLNRLNTYVTSGRLSSSTSSRASVAIGDLVRLSAEVRRLDVVLANDKIQALALDSTLREIAETHRVVESEVGQCRPQELRTGSVQRRCDLPSVDRRRAHRGGRRGPVGAVCGSHDTAQRKSWTNWSRPARSDDAAILF